MAGPACAASSVAGAMRVQSSPFDASPRLASGRSRPLCVRSAASARPRRTAYAAELDHVGDLVQQLSCELV